MEKNANPDTAVSKAHDIFFRKLMSDQRVSKEFFEAHLPTELQNKIKLDRLELQSGTFIDDWRRESIVDMLFKTQMHTQDVYLYLLVDHQSTPDELMPFRILKYLCNIMDYHLKEEGKKRIPFIFPIVVYHGKAPWHYSRDIQDLVDAPVEWIERYFLKPFKLVDLNQIEDEVIKRKTWSGVMELALKHIFERDFFPFFGDILNMLQEIERQQGKQFVENVLVYIFDRGEINREQFVASVKNALSEELGGKMMTLAEQFRAEGKAEGRKEGRITVAERLLSEGVDAAFVARMTDLSVDEIQQLEKSVH